MPRVVFTPSGLSGTVEPGASVLDAARRLGVDLDTMCGGRGICGRCQVEPSSGSFAKWAISSNPEALGELTALERDYEVRGNARRPLPDGRRLGCAARIASDAVIDVPPESQVHRQVVRKSVDVEGLVIDPQFTLLFSEIPGDELGSGAALSDIVADAVATQHGRRPNSYTTAALRHLDAAVSTDHRTVTVAIDRRDKVTAVWPGFVDRALGMAVDVGSTTVAGHLCDLATGEVVCTSGLMNPQIRFGEDLMSRVSYVMMNPGGERELTAAIRTALDDLLCDLLEEAGATRQHVLDVVIVGNPIMHHIVLGIDPTPLGQAPFTLATARAVRTTATDLDIGAPFATAFVGPCIAGHVGADTTAAMLAQAPHRGDDWQLLVDVGTNAEIVLGKAGKQFAASSPTGPAFEGAQISCGQRATAGAIERVRINRDTLEPRVKVIGCELWSDHPAFATQTADLTISGVCGSGIIEAIGEMYLAGVIDHQGVIRGERADSGWIRADDRTFRYVLFRADGLELTISQNDVRAIQLAKAALRAGIDVLLAHAGIHEVADVRLAGAFGAHIDPLYAVLLGLVPDAPVDTVTSVGNAAGAGAVRALLSMEARDELETLATQVTKIETATEASFQELFVAAMGIPHTTAPSPHLGAVVDLPTRTSPEATGTRRRRRQETHT
jgi:uncharacterized 2Fe-2S/4Fe-4S cluster protein (DUF4445 family)